MSIARGDRSGASHDAPSPASRSRRAAARATDSHWAEIATLSAIQPQLEVGSVDDPQEREAERVADAVVAGDEAVPAVATGAAPAPPLRREAAPPDAGAPAVGRELASTLEGARGRGEPLAAEQRAFFEPRLGADLGGVRVHNDGVAASAARALRANAFALGTDIFFAGGRYAPAAPEGRRLLAHELTHVLQQPAGAPLRARRAPAEMAAPPEQDALELAVAEVLRDAALTGEAEGFAERLAAAALATLSADTRPADTRPAAADVVEQRSEYLAGAEAESGGPVAILHALATLGEHEGLLPYAESGHGFDYLLRTLAGHVASYLRAAATESPEGDQVPSFVLWAPILYDLAWAREAAAQPESLLHLELEASVQRLLELRHRFTFARGAADRAMHGREVGVASRRALLLDRALLEMRRNRPRTDSDAATPLDEAITGVLVEIEAVREEEARESETQRSLGDDVELLGLQTVSLFPGEYPSATDVEARAILPEEAFPETVDATTLRLLSEVTSRVEGEQSSVAALHGDVIPRSPTYTLQEFAEVFRRWFAFFSLKQESIHPIFRLYASLLGEPYKLMGSAALSGVGAVEGAVARAYLMNMAVRGLQQHLGRASPQFAEQVASHRRAATPAEGWASAVDYRFAELYPERGRNDLSLAGEKSSREERIRGRTEETARTYSELALKPPATQPIAAVELKILAPSDEPLPFARLRRVEAAEGWSYLIDVRNEREELVAREHQVMPPEVARYLMARRQLVGTLERPHRLTTERGVSIGDAAVREGGVEAAEGLNAARYLSGEGNPELPGEVLRSRAVLASARREQRVSELTDRRESDAPERITEELIAELERYLEEYFTQREGAEYRIGAVLLIADAEYGIGKDVAALLTPENILKIVAQALAISLSLAVLQSLGPLGGLVGRALGAGLSSQGVSDLAAVVGLANFLRESGEARTFNAARAWAVAAPAAVGDATELFEGLVAMPVNHAVRAITRGQPRTPNELADVCEPLMRDPAAREALIHGVNERIAELQASGAGRERSDPELEALQAFRSRLSIAEKLASHPEDVAHAAGDVEIPGRRATTPETELFAGGRRRSSAERATLEAAIPPELRGTVRIVENPLLKGTTVRVVYRNGDLRMEVGHEADATHIAAHVATARHLARYQGVMGWLRSGIARLASALGLGEVTGALGLPSLHGTRGAEAELELKKLEPILVDLMARQARVEKQIEEAGDLSVHQERADAIAREIESISRQLLLHMKHVGSPEKGVGYVAAEDLTGKGVAPGAGAVAPASRTAADYAAMRKTLEEYDAAKRRLDEYQSTLEITREQLVRAERSATRDFDRIRKIATKLEEVEAEHAARAREVERLAKELDKATGSTVARERWDAYRYEDLKNFAPCFLPGTLVKTASGDRRIEDLVAGDVVLSYDVASGRVVEARVETPLRSWTDRVRRLRVGDVEIATTRAHPFWESRRAGWVAAGQLAAGDLVRSLSGSALEISAAETSAEVTPTHNLVIAGTHNYFVGRTGVLVHNGGEEAESNFADKQARQTWIYRVLEKQPDGSEKVVYIGKTYQSGGVGGRFVQHLSIKPEWVAKGYRVEAIPGASGKWTNFETAVWEQHFIEWYRAQGAVLENEKTAIRKDKFDQFKNGYGFNPCA